MLPTARGEGAVGCGLLAAGGVVTSQLSFQPLCFWSSHISFSGYLHGIIRLTLPAPNLRLRMVQLNLVLNGHISWSLPTSIALLVPQSPSSTSDTPEAQGA